MRRGSLPPVRAVPGLLGAIGLLALLPAGCGRKGDPIAPGRTLPSPPPQVTLSGEGGVLRVAWAEPSEDLAGRPLRPGLRYRVLRASWPPGEPPCETCPEDLAVAAEVDPVAREAQGLAPRAWSDPDAEPGRTYRYRVETLDARGRAGPPSPPVGIGWFPPPAPAAAVSEGDGELAVSAPPAELVPGWTPEGLRLYEGAGPRRARTESRGPGATAVVGLPNGAAWEGEARWAARSPEGWLVEGSPAPVRGTPRDAVPPLPPADLVAVAGAEGARLHWVPSGGEAYASVTVFRAAAGGDPEVLVRLGGAEVSFVDRQTEPGREYRYHVVAEDGAGNRSLPSREAALRMPGSGGAR